MPFNASTVPLRMVSQSPTKNRRRVSVIANHLVPTILKDTGDGSVQELRMIAVRETKPPSKNSARARRTLADRPLDKAPSPEPVGHKEVADVFHALVSR